MIKSRIVPPKFQTVVFGDRYIITEYRDFNILYQRSKVMGNLSSFKTTARFKVKRVRYFNGIKL